MLKLVTIGFILKEFTKMLLLIAQDEVCDIQIVKLGALLHDIADSKFNDGDETVGPKVARAFLESQNVSEEIIIHVVNIIENISFKGGNFEKKLVLVYHHAKDACKHCQASEPPYIIKGLSTAPFKKLMVVDGGANPRGDECAGQHWHGFIGMEQEAISQIASWIRNPANSGTTPSDWFAGRIKTSVQRLIC